MSSAKQTVKPKCEGCSLSPFRGIRLTLVNELIQNNEGGGHPIERCDVCEVYESDYDAQVAAMTLLLVRHQREARY